MMFDPVIFLSRPASEGLAMLHAPQAASKRMQPMGRLLLTALFAAAAGLTCALVVIFGAPGGDPTVAQGDDVRMAIQPSAR